MNFEKIKIQGGFGVHLAPFKQKSCLWCTLPLIDCVTVIPTVRSGHQTEFDSMSQNSTVNLLPYSLWYRLYRTLALFSENTAQVSLINKELYRMSYSSGL